MVASLRAGGRRAAPHDVRSNPEARSAGPARLDCFVARAPRNDGLAAVILTAMIFGPLALLALLILGKRRASKTGRASS
jgi:hypothetical protein